MDFLDVADTFPPRAHPASLGHATMDSLPPDRDTDRLRWLVPHNKHHAMCRARRRAHKAWRATLVPTITVTFLFGMLFLIANSILSGGLLLVLLAASVAAGIAAALAAKALTYALHATDLGMSAYRDAQIVRERRQIIDASETRGAVELSYESGEGGHLSLSNTGRGDLEMARPRAQD